MPVTLTIEYHNVYSQTEKDNIYEGGDETLVVCLFSWGHFPKQEDSTCTSHRLRRVPWLTGTQKKRHSLISFSLRSTDLQRTMTCRIMQLWVCCKSFTKVVFLFFALYNLTRFSKDVFCTVHTWTFIYNSMSGGGSYTSSASRVLNLFLVMLQAYSKMNKIHYFPHNSTNITP